MGPPPAGHLSEQVDRVSETAAKDLAPWPRYSEPAEARFTGLVGSGFICGQRNENKKAKMKMGEEERESILFFLTFLSLPVNPTLSAPLSPHSSPLSAFSIPFQSPSEHSENASSYYFTYAVHQSDRVRITLSMTPKSRRYRSLGLHGIAVTTSGSPGWDREPLGKPDWVKPFSVQPSVI